MTDLLIPVAAAGLVGSLHCAGMCGGLVTFATASPGRANERRLALLASYNLSRGAGYAVIGALAGALGGAVDDVGVRTGIGRTASVVAGAVMLAWGAARLLEASGVSLARFRLPSRLQNRLGNAIRKAQGKPPLLRAAVIGGCTAALPCGFLHAFTVVAAGTASPASGAAVMAAFWLGTLPALAGLGFSVQSLTARLRRHASVVSAIALVGVGLASVAGHLRVPLAAGEQTLGAAGPPTAASLPTEPPCHARRSHPR